MRSSTVGRLSKNVIRMLIAVVMLTVSGIPAKAADNSPRTLAEPRTSAHEGSATSTSPESVQPAVPSGEAAPERSTSGPSLDQILVLLQAQSREIEALRAELREQKELTERLEAKVNSTGARPAVTEPVAESVAAAQTISQSSAAEGDLAQKVAKLEADLGNS